MVHHVAKLAWPQHLPTAAAEKSGNIGPSQNISSSETVQVKLCGPWLITWKPGALRKLDWASRLGLALGWERCGRQEWQPQWGGDQPYLRNVCASRTAALRGFKKELNHLTEFCTEINGDLGGHGGDQPCFSACACTAAAGHSGRQAAPPPESSPAAIQGESCPARSSCSLHA